MPKIDSTTVAVVALAPPAIHFVAKVGHAVCVWVRAHERSMRIAIIRGHQRRQWALF
jgi:hypothetical protein